VDALTLPAALKVNCMWRSYLKAASCSIVLILWVCNGDTKVETVYWSCPYGSKANDFQVRNRNADYSITIGDWNADAGAIGVVDVTISKKN
jgi:hypothetical protein